MFKKSRKVIKRARRWGIVYCIVLCIELMVSLYLLDNVDNI